MCTSTCDEEPKTPSIGWANTQDVGGCNFCVLPRPQKVLVIRAPSGLVVRMCARCHGMVRQVRR